MRRVSEARDCCLHWKIGEELASVHITVNSLRTLQAACHPERTGAPSAVQLGDGESKDPQLFLLLAEHEILPVSGRSLGFMPTFALAQAGTIAMQYSGAKHDRQGPP